MIKLYNIGGKMSKIILPGLICLLLFVLVQSEYNLNGKDKLKVVDTVEIKRYCGLWYEIARIPNSFQAKCAGQVTAEYKLIQNGKLKVINRCKNENGNLTAAEGVAKIVDKKTNAKLKVSFVQIFGLNLFWGDYWIIGLDKNYKWAVVGNPDRKYGWILGRKPSLSGETMQAIYKLLGKKGYDPAKFQMTAQ